MWSWFTGWFNFLGQVAVTAGIDFGAAFFINAWLNLVFGTPTYHWVTIIIYACVLLLHGLLNRPPAPQPRNHERQHQAGAGVMGAQTREDENSGADDGADAQRRQRDGARACA